MSKKYLLLCNRHNSIYGDNWCLWWGNRESKSGYASDVRIAHRFDEKEIEEYIERGRDIPVPIEVLGLSEEYEPIETYNSNFVSLVEKGTLNRLMGLQLKQLFKDDDEDTKCPNCGSEELEETCDFDETVFICQDCEYEFNESGQIV